MLDKRKMMVIAAFVALVASVHGQLRQADADPKYIATQAGESITLLCRFPSKIATCRFSIDALDIKLNPDWQTRQGSSFENFEYFGRGLVNGECGVRIINVKESYHGNATCILDPNDGLADAVGNIEIVIAKEPHIPVVSVRPENDRHEAGKEIEASCESVDGRPAAAITWFLNDQPLGTGKEETFESGSNGTNYYTVVSTLRYRVKPEDQGAALICRASHPAHQDGFSDTSYQLNVVFRPIALPETFISGLEIGRSAVIGPITIQANPAPKLLWTIDGVTIRQGDQKERYVAREPVNVGSGRWNASLEITELTLQDTTRTYRLRADNEFGAQDYQIRIGGSQDVADSGLGVVSIIAITIISIFVLVIAALIVVAKVTKRWCFAGASMHPNGPDSEAQIAPEDDKTHEHYEQHEKATDEDTATDTGAGDAVKATNGKAKGNTSV